MRGRLKFNVYPSAELLVNVYKKKQIASVKTDTHVLFFTIFIYTRYGYESVREMTSKFYQRKKCRVPAF